MKIAFFVIVVLVVLTDSCYYAGKRLITPLSFEKKNKKRLWLGWILFFVVVVSAMFLFRFLHGMPVYLTFVSYFLLGWIINVLLILLFRDLTELPINIFRCIRAKLSNAEYSRFSFIRTPILWSLFVPSLAMGLMIAGLIQAFTIPTVVSVDVPIKDLPEEMDGFTIVQLSDLHAGATVGTSYVEKVVEISNALNPSMIAITGDMVEGRVNQIGPEVAPLKKLNADYGVFWVGGNHENYWDYAKWMENALNSGYRVLHNSHIEINVAGACLVIAGVPDEAAHGGYKVELESSSLKAQEGSSDCPKILLSHRAEKVEEALEAGYDLMLTGHTHGGQFFPLNFIVDAISPFPTGLHQSDSMWVYVNRGAGWWGPPTRLGVPNEITKLTLKKL